MFFLAYLIDSSFSLQSQNIMRCSPFTMPRFPVEGIYDFAALPLFAFFTQGFRPQIPYNRSTFRSFNIKTWLLLLTRKLRRRHRQPSIISGDEDAHWVSISFSIFNQSKLLFSCPKEAQSHITTPQPPSEGRTPECAQQSPALWGIPGWCGMLFLPPIPPCVFRFSVGMSADSINSLQRSEKRDLGFPFILNIMPGRLCFFSRSDFCALDLFTQKLCANETESGWGNAPLPIEASHQPAPTILCIRCWMSPAASLTLSLTAVDVRLANYMLVFLCIFVLRLQQLPSFLSHFHGHVASITKSKIRSFFYTL